MTSPSDWWSNLNQSWKLILATAVILAIAYFVYKRQSEPAPVTATGVPVTVLPSIPHGSPQLPQPDGKIASKTTIITRHKVTPEDTVGTIIADTTKIYTMEDPKEPPLVHGDSLTSVTYAKVRDPWVQFQIDLMLGGSASRDGVSPYGGVSFVKAFESFRLGLGVDKFGAGPSLNWEFWREFNLGATYRRVKFVDSTPWSATVSYRF